MGLMTSPGLPLEDVASDRRPLLIAYDGSGPSRCAVAEAAALAADRRAIVLTVWLSHAAAAGAARAAGTRAARDGGGGGGRTEDAEEAPAGESCHGV